LPEAPLLKNFLFADDTVFLAKGKNIEELTKFVYCRIVHYFRSKKLSLHPEKVTKFSVFITSYIVHKNPLHNFANYSNLSDIQKPELIVLSENVNINSCVPATRYLGVYFDTQLNFKHHISTLTNKLTKMLYFFKQTKHVLTPKA
jgi:hypothetical protein